MAQSQWIQNCTSVIQCIVVILALLLTYQEFFSTNAREEKQKHERQLLLDRQMRESTFELMMLKISPEVKDGEKAFEDLIKSLSNPNSVTNLINEISKYEKQMMPYIRTDLCDREISLDVACFDILNYAEGIKKVNENLKEKYFKLSEHDQKIFEECRKRPQYYGDEGNK